MTWTVLGPALRRIVSAAVTLCMVVAFNLPSAIPAAAASAGGLSRSQGLGEFVLFEGEHQDAAYTAGAQSGVTISAAELAAVQGSAAAQWPGWNVSGASVFLQELPGDALAITSGNSIAVDPTAAGWGWSATTDAPAPGTMDLLTVLAHEYGHIAGFADVEGGTDLMTRTLSPGSGASTAPSGCTRHLLPSRPPNPQPNRHLQPNRSPHPQPNRHLHPQPNRSPPRNPRPLRPPKPMCPPNPSPHRLPRPEPP